MKNRVAPSIDSASIGLRMALFSPQHLLQSTDKLVADLVAASHQFMAVAKAMDGGGE